MNLLNYRFSCFLYKAELKYQKEHNLLVRVIQMQKKFLQCSGEKHQQQQNDKTRIVGFRINKTKCAKNNSYKSFKNAKHTFRLPSVWLLAD